MGKIHLGVETAKLGVVICTHLSALNVTDKGLHSYKPDYSGCHRASTGPHLVRSCMRVLYISISPYIFVKWEFFSKI